jgi:hydroxymethylbilane synthase
LKSKFVLGSRGSQLALWQTHYIKNLLQSFFPSLELEIKIIQTTGDAILDTALSKIGDKGLFTKQIEDELLSGTIDLAVHSLKDLPTRLPEGLKLGGVTTRETPNDVLISEKYFSIDELPHGARVATGSLRRRSQLLGFRPDFEIVEIRGNVPTRIKKFQESDLDAMILAYAGVHRLELDSHIKQIIPTEIMLPAVGQGVVGIEIRETDAETEELLKPVINQETLSCITAERAFLRRLEGGCQVPIGGFAALENDEIFLSGFTGSLDGKSSIQESIRGNRTDAEILGTELAENLIEKGASELLAETRHEAKAKSEQVI